VAAPTLIYCANGDAKLLPVAMEHGFKYGCCLPGTVYFPLYFADQDWRAPNRETYMAALAEHRPAMASVLDLEHREQLPEVLDWAEEASQFVQQVVIIPKAFGVISCLPRQIGGVGVTLGYSVPTRFAGTQVPAWEFRGWPVHLLGGAPQAQMRLARYLDVVSADGNYAHKLAVTWNRYWVPGNGRFGHRWQEALSDTHTVGQDAPLEAFRRSCQNIIAAWKSAATF
jgi:hypothetical protein